MQNNLNELVKQKELILKHYEKILKNEMLLSYDIKKEDILERVKNLKDERFIVSICGQMNSGKSTLLNSYLFGDLILPYSDTTQTAKLTIINYSEKPYFEPVFYTQNEWDEVKKSYRGNEEFNESLKIAEGAEININHILEKKSEKIYDIKMLSKYVAVPKHGGVYSPFVNYVNLFYPNEILKDVTMVDTPGINDPNKLREKITLEWVKKSDAVLYVTWALGAFTEDDFSFIDKNLLHIPKDNMVIAVNKSDNSDNTESIKEWMDSLLDTEKFRYRKIYDKSTPRVFVCSLGELIRKMNEKNISLNDELKFSYNKYSNSKDDYTNKENNKIEILGKEIEEKLVKNKGAKLLDSHKEFIESLFKRIKNIIDLKLDSNKVGQSDYDKDNEQLQLDLDNLEKQKQKIEKEFKELDFKKRKLINDLSNKQDRSVRTLKEDIVTEIRKEISKIDNIKLFYDQVPWILKKTFDNNIDILANTFKELTDAYNNEVENEIESFVNVLSRYQLFSKDFVRSSFNLSTFEISREFTEFINNNLTRNHIESMIEGITSGWARFFNTETGRRQSVEFLTNKTDEIIGNEITSVQKQARDEIRESVNKVFDELNSMANELINERVDSKKKAMKKKDDKEKELQELKEEEQKLIQTKNDIILSEKEINQ